MMQVSCTLSGVSPSCAKTVTYVGAGDAHISEVSHTSASTP
nr:TPA_asm: m32.6 sORF 1 [Murid betaherpesvirus 1]DBA07958.1 TPA_asm: m32.6 sORF 1 [Murid betaherpesvirus 1]